MIRYHVVTADAGRYTLVQKQAHHKQRAPVQQDMLVNHVKQIVLVEFTIQDNLA
jgi:hypothetical protein